MPSHRFLPLLVCILAWPVSGVAGIFKCIGENGELTFSQTPCVNSTLMLQESSEGGVDEPIECEHAHRFALATAQQMRAGAESSSIFDRYGGLSELSRGSVSLISYVYQFRTNNKVSAARIAALSATKCRARSFGDVSCDQLPDLFTTRIGGCERSPQVDGAAVPFVEETPAQGPVAAQESRSSRQAAQRAARAKKRQKREKCRDRLRARIDRINSRMRSGYTSSQGISLRNKRRELEKQLRKC